MARKKNAQAQKPVVVNVQVPKAGQPQQNSKQKSKKKKPNNNGPKGLDLWARRYRNLILDPCNEELVGGPTDYGSGMLLKRTKRMMTYGGANTSKIWLYHPFAGLFEWENTGSLTAGIPRFDQTGSVPNEWVWTATTAETDFNTNVVQTSFRPLAGCVKVMHRGSEQNRSGMIHCGLLTIDQLWARGMQTSTGTLSNLSLQTFINMLPHMERMPVAEIEQLWLPSTQEMDNTFESLSVTNGDLSLKYLHDNGFGSSRVLVVVATGVNSGSDVLGLTMITCYESASTVDVDNGLLSGMSKNSKTRNTMREILSTIDPVVTVKSIATVAAGNPMAALGMFAMESGVLPPMVSKFAKKAIRAFT